MSGIWSISARKMRECARPFVLKKDRKNRKERERDKKKTTKIKQTKEEGEQKMHGSESVHTSSVKLPSKNSASMEKQKAFTGLWIVGLAVTSILGRKCFSEISSVFVNYWTDATSGRRGFLIHSLASRLAWKVLIWLFVPQPCKLCQVKLCSFSWWRKNHCHFQGLKQWMFRTRTSHPVS